MAFCATGSLLISLTLHQLVVAELGLDPAAALAVLAAAKEPDITAAAAHLKACSAVVFSGRALRGLAEAAALGAMELGRMPAYALEGGQFRHGPLEILGPKIGVVIFRAADPWPRPGTEILVDHGEVRVGGAAGNTALAWQATNVPYQIAGNTGSDQFGDWLRQSFPAHCDRWPVEDTATTFSVGITHPDGERTFFTIPGHMPLLDLETVQQSLRIDELEGGLALICGCYLTDRLVADYPALFAWLQDHAVEIALDTGWAPHRSTSASLR